MEIRVAGGASRTPRARIGRTRHSKRRSYRPPHAKPARICGCSLRLLSHRSRRGSHWNRLEAVELKPLLERLRPALYIGDANLYGKVDAIDGSILPREKRFVAGDMREDKGVQPWASLLSDGSAPLPAITDIHSPAVALATSGTTGVPKIVIHTQATLAALFGLP